MLDTTLNARIQVFLDKFDAALAAADAQGALQLLAGEDIGLVISDVHMPGANGYELLSSIKRLHPYLPVVLMTAYGTVAQAVAAMREGATDYIVKPFDAQALIDMAQRQLAAPAIQFKGAGWYVTDYGGKSSPDPKAEKSSGSSSSSPDKSEKSGSSEKSEKKESKAEKPAASKPKEK